MFLKHVPTGNLIEILDLQSLADPFHAQVAGRFHAGEELQDPEKFSKSDLLFPSEETLPKCWTNPDYKQQS